MLRRDKSCQKISEAGLLIGVQALVKMYMSEEAWTRYGVETSLMPPLWNDVVIFKTGFQDRVQFLDFWLLTWHSDSKYLHVAILSIGQNQEELRGSRLGSVECSWSLLPAQSKYGLWTPHKFSLWHKKKWSEDIVMQATYGQTSTKVKQF